MRPKIYEFIKGSFTYYGISRGGGVFSNAYGWLRLGDPWLPMIAEGVKKSKKLIT